MKKPIHKNYHKKYFVPAFFNALFILPAMCINQQLCIKEINKRTHICDIFARCDAFIVVGGHDTKDIFNPTIITILRMVTF